MEQSHDRSSADRLAVPLDGGWTLIPLISAAGGAWALNPGLWSDTPTALVVMLALVAGSWLPLWRSLTRTDWAAAFSVWATWSTPAPARRWPYVQPGTPGDHLRRRLALARSWWQGLGRDCLAYSLRRASGAIVVGLLLSLALGRQSILLSLVVLTLAQLAALWHEGRGRVGALWTSVALVGIPWFLGASLDATDGAVMPVLSGLALALVIGLHAQPNGWAVVGPVLGAAFLLWQGYPEAVGWLLLLAIPGLMMLTTRPNREAYRRTIGPWVLAMVALMAWTL